MSFLNMPQAVLTLCSTVFCALYLNETLELAALQFHTDTDTPIHNFACKDQVLKDGIKHCSQSAASGCFYFDFFFVAFLSWFRQKAPLSDKDSILPNSHTSWTWTFWSDFCWRTGTKIMITFQPPTTSVSSVKMRLSSYSCTLRSESISILSRARESPNSYLLMQLLELHNPHASAEHTLVLMECLLRKRCVIAKVTWKDKSVIIFVIFTKIIQ